MRRFILFLLPPLRKKEWRIVIELSWKNYVILIISLGMIIVTKGM